MPTINPAIDENTCLICGRKFQSAGEWKEHQPNCAAAGIAGYDHGKVVDGNRDETADDDWTGRPEKQPR